MKPLISVIVPTYNRVHLLKRLLESLQVQSLETHFFEVIVVDDGSMDSTKELLSEMQTSMVNLTVLRQQNRGPAAARNTGARSATGYYLAFTDDDCVAAPNWLFELLNTFAYKQCVAIQGRTSTWKRACTPLTHQISNETGHSAVPTCNAAYEARIFAKAGGFDEGFPSPHNEDADLAWRVSQLGRIEFEPNARIIHPPRRDRFSHIAGRMKMLASEFYLYHKNKALYRRFRNRTPWRTIYGEVFFSHQLRNLKSNFRFLRQPTLFVKGLGLSLVWWVQLITLLPTYLKEDRRCRALFMEAHQ